MSLTITEALHQAEEAVNGGDYHSATTICNQLVHQFPGYVAAYRLLGEAYREQGHAQDAEAAFTAALTRHPRLPRAYLNLGLIAEDQGAVDTALAFCQVAWELAPGQSAMREFLTRVAMRRYGSDGDLQFTHAALAQLHSNASRLRRAVAAYRSALAELPGRIDLQIGLAETLWALGQDDEAARICRSILEQSPEAVQPLVILADIEKRQGASRQADDLLKRARVSDPDGSITRSLLEKNPRADRAYLELPADAVPTLSAEIASAPAERPKIAPAPDFVYQPPRAGAPAHSNGHGQMVEDFTSAPPSWNAASVHDDVASADLPGEILPFSPEEFGASSDDVDAAANFLTDLNLEEVSEQPFDVSHVDTVESVQAPQPDRRFVGPETQPLASIPLSNEVHTDIDDLTSLADSLRGDVADALARAGEPVTSDDFKYSRPDDSVARGSSTTLEGLADEGLTPFDPFADGMIDYGSAPGGQASSPAFEGSGDAQAHSASALSHDWDTIDTEIQQAVPSQIPHGYTDQLRALDEIGLVPFEAEETDDEAEGVAPFNPFDFDSPMPGTQSSQPLSGAMAPPPAPEAEVSGDADDIMADLQPFTIEEAEAGAPAASSQSGQPVSFFAGGNSASAIPSDDDFAALLAFDDDDELSIDPSHGLAATMPLVATGHDTHQESFEDTIALPEDVQSSYPESDGPVGQPQQPEMFTPVETAPELDESHFDDFFMSGAVTRRLPDDDDAEVDNVVSHVEPELVDVELRPGTEMFTRARAIKLGLVSDGVITGDRELAEDDTDEVPVFDDTTMTTDAPRHLAAVVTDEASVSVTRDTETLRAALELTPDDDELRWWLAEALRSRGDFAAAYTEYRWLIRNAPNRHEAVLEALVSCVELDPSPELAHRLLGDLYRRRGDIARASNHAALALQYRRRSSREG